MALNIRIGIRTDFRIRVVEIRTGSVVFLVDLDKFVDITNIPLRKEGSITEVIISIDQYKFLRKEDLT